MAPDDLEDEVQRLGRRIGALAGRGHVRLGGGAWTEHLLDWALASPEFKNQLFRLVDVLPACTDDADVMRHLEEYLECVDVPRVIDTGIAVAERVPFGAHLSARAARRGVVRMARQFIAGETPSEAMPRLARLWRAGEASTVDLLGEKTLTATEADAYAARVGELLDTLVQATASWPDDPALERDPWGVVPRANVSVKATALTPRFDPVDRDRSVADAFTRLRPVLLGARSAGATVHLDTEQYAVKDLTYGLLRAIGEEFPDGPQLGCVVQAYLRDSFRDLDGLIEWSAASLRTPLQIRLVKGAYWDAETIEAEAAGWPSPVFAEKHETDANYERCVRLLVERAGAVRPAFASHNIRSLAYAIASARAAGLHDTAFELQLLYGMAAPVHDALRRLGLRIRVYAPVGELIPGMAYLVRRLLENTSNESFIRQRFAEHEELDRLLAPPRLSEASVGDLAADDAADDERPPTDAAGGPFSNEPHAELRRAAPRERLTRAVKRAAGGPAIAAPVLVAGARVATSGVIESRDPSCTSRIVATSGRAGVADVERAIDVALDAWPAWRARPWGHRAAVLFRAAALLRSRRAELAALEVLEAGKPLPEADADVAEAIDFCEYYGREALRLGAGGPVGRAPGETNRYSYEPRGVGAVIAPWNFPLAIPAGMTTAALVTGNAVLLKPAEQTPAVAYRLVQVLLEAGVPPGVLAFLPGVGEEIGPALVEHPDVAFVAFTGSKAVGLEIIERAARPHPGRRQLTRVIAEMGGKNAAVVDADADLDVAVPAIVASAFGYAGQKCSAVSRVVVDASVFDEFTARLVGAVEVLPVGSAHELRTVVGPLIDEQALERVHAYQQLAAGEGDVVLQGADVPAGGWYAAPTVVVVDKPEAKVFTDEIFGPVLSCIAADDFDHALALANATDYALTAGFFSRSPARIRRAASALRAGNVYVNRATTGALVGRQPFGGFGMSGVGSKAGGPDYLLQFVEPRVVTENTVRQGFASDQ
ncbi:MAG: proline dehydrogenase family protein [Actinobacteria bacterium]|nr:proline dehydrogenase family protein [Actinomycetota bacterium]